MLCEKVDCVYYPDCLGAWNICIYKNRFKVKKMETTKTNDKFQAELISIVLIETKKAVKAILKEELKKFKKEADKNKDGKVSVEEGIDYGMELLNKSGLYLIFGLFVAIIATAGFMLWRSNIDWDTFLMIVQITVGPTISSYIVKVIVGRLGTNVTLLKKKNIALTTENSQLHLNLGLKKAHDEEFPEKKQFD